MLYRFHVNLPLNLCGAHLQKSKISEIAIIDQVCYAVYLKTDLNLSFSRTSNDIYINLTSVMPVINSIIAVII